jgi:thymidine kinase
MPKLYFRYGVMNSSKTANMLMVTHNYNFLNRNVLIMKPKLDTRFGKDTISSRVGIQTDCDILIDDKFDATSFEPDYLKSLSCILVDECQFLSSENIDNLRLMTSFVPVICYGLKTDYRTQLFPGSKRLLEIADTIEEIKNVCVSCEKKAIINAKIINGVLTTDGSDKPDLGAEEKYQPMCWCCWFNEKIEKEIKNCK